MRRFFIIFLITFLIIYADENKGLVNPSKGLITPVSDILNPLDVLLSGGGIVGIEEERYFLGSINIGLGDLMELEVNSSTIISAIEMGSVYMPASIFKMMFLKANEQHPGFSLFLKKTLWNIEQYNNIKFYTRFSELYIIGGLRFSLVYINLAGKITDIRAKSESSGIPITSDFKKKIYGVTGNIIIKANPKTFGMFEFTDKIKFEDPDTINGRILDKNITNVFVFSLGGRYFLTKNISIDAGVIYRSDYKGPADAVINACINIGLQLSDLNKVSNPNILN